MKSFLEGGAARPQGPGIYTVSEGVRFRTFNPQGGTLMEVLTPEATYDDHRKEISSAQTLKMRTAEGRFAIEGQGFLWRQTNSSLFISNAVQTLISPELLATQVQDEQSARSPIKIEASSFAYSGETGLGTYQGAVKVTGTNLALAGERLLIEVPITTDIQHATNVAVRSITLDQDVVIDYEGVHATGQRVLYTNATGFVDVEGSPSWRTQYREGSADRITIDSSNRVFRALGNAWLKLAGPEVERASFLGGWFQSADASAPKTAVGRQLHFRSEDYEIRTNQAIFTNHVRVEEIEGDRPAGTLVCEQLQLAFTGTNELNSMVATGSVSALHGDRKVAGQEFTYDGQTKKALVTGNPEWQAAERSGRGDLLEADTASEELLVRGHAVMRLPAREFSVPGQSQGARPGQPVASRPGVSAETNAWAEIRSQEYRLSRTSGQFTGGVEIEHPQMHWWSDVLAIRFTPGGGTADEIDATPARFELSNPKGQIHGKGAHAVYRNWVDGALTNSLLTLTGEPATLTQPNGPSIASSSLLFDVGRSTFVVPAGKYRILGPTNATVDTNAFQFPRGLGDPNTRLRTRRR